MEAVHEEEEEVLWHSSGFFKHNKKTFFAEENRKVFLNVISYKIKLHISKNPQLVLLT